MAVAELAKSAEENLKRQRFREPQMEGETQINIKRAVPRSKEYKKCWGVGIFEESDGS
jgi:hypothetical protein